MDELQLSSSYEREHWGPPKKHKRYQRVEDREKYRKNFAASNIGKDVDPTKGRRFHKNYG